MTGQICLNTVYSSTFKLPSNNSFRLWIKARLTLQCKQAKSCNAAGSEGFVTQVRGVEFEVCVCVCLCPEVSCYSCRLLIDPDKLREWCTSQGLAPGAGFICAGLHDGTHTQKHTHISTLLMSVFRWARYTLYLFVCLQGYLCAKYTHT